MCVMGPWSAWKACSAPCGTKGICELKLHLHCMIPMTYGDLSLITPSLNVSGETNKKLRSV